MAFTAWASGTAYSLNDVRSATTFQDSGLVFKCTTAGTSGSSEPDWGTDIGSEVTDNTVVWTAVSSLYEELAVLAPNAIIELWELHLVSSLHGSADVYRWHNGTNNAVSGGIVWNSNTYTPQPIQAEGFAYTSSGSLPRPTLTIGNLDRSITTLLVSVNATTAGNDLLGATVKRIRVLRKHLDGQSAADPYASFPVEKFLIDRKSSETIDQVSYELASEFDMIGQAIPRRQLIANVCQWEYRSTECGYSGSNYWDVDDNAVGTLAADRCGKRIGSCKLRFGGTNGNDPLPFGSFPGIGLQ